MAVVFMALALVTSACGGGSDPKAADVTTQDTAPTAEPTVPVAETTAPETPTTPPEPEGSIEDVEAATVKIVAEGRFASPETLDQVSQAGIGTGFIISEDGLVVTNNHVVTGASLLRVWVPGSDKPVNAKILGVSECNDLAVIDLDGGGYPTLEFREDPVKAGLNVYAAGYPLTDSTSIEAVDYTLTRGIVSTAEASGETQWASVDSVIEHDARIRGGNSGGPLVDEQGRVVAVNYAGNTDDQSFAISAQDAIPVIEELKSGDVESIGINGEALVTESGSTGVWVASVDAGGPADKAGIEPGDIITSLGGLELALDGTMADYCDIIRTHSPGDVIDVEVVRLATEEFWSGQINGDPMTLGFSFATELAADVEATTPSSSGGGGYTEYAFVTDDSGSVGVEIPVEWSETDGTANPDFGPSLWASPDLASFAQTFGVPGIIVEITDQAGLADLQTVLDGVSFASQCVGQGAEEFTSTDGRFVGLWEVFSDCGDTGALMVTLAVVPDQGDFVLRMVIQVVEERDLEAADRALATFDAAL